MLAEAEANSKADIMIYCERAIEALWITIREIWESIFKQFLKE